MQPPELRWADSFARYYPTQGGRKDRSQIYTILSRNGADADVPYIVFFTLSLSISLSLSLVGLRTLWHVLTQLLPCSESKSPDSFQPRPHVFYSSPCLYSMCV
jgi:hypothetical protein